MLELADLRFIRSVANATSLASAARSMNITPSAVSQKLQQIEVRIGLKLVQRNPSGIVLTPDGQHLIELGDDLLMRADSLKESILERKNLVAGPIRVIAPSGFGRIVVAPVVSELCNLHQDLEPVLILSDNPVGTIRRSSWDVIVHVGRLPDMETPQRKIASNRRILVASPSYVNQHGAPIHPSELSHHWLGAVRDSYDDPCIWSLRNEQGTQAKIRIKPKFSCNDGEVIRAWAAVGMGIVERSEWAVAEEIKTQSLVRVLPEWTLPNADIVTLVNPKTTRSIRVDTFLEVLTRSIREQIGQVSPISG